MPGFKIAAMFSLQSIRKYIAGPSWSIGAFSFLFLILSSLGYFAHDHADDPFHLTRHDSCPVTIWSHSPFVAAVADVSVVVISFVIELVFCLRTVIILQENSCVHSSRAPPFSLS
jgi:hypothetical protein